MSEKRHILMTGATGLVGSDVLTELLHAGHRVTVLAKANHSFPQGVNHIVFDALTDAVDKALSELHDVQVIVHNAAVKVLGANAEERECIQKVNVDFSLALIDFAKQKRVEKFLFVSTFSGLKRPLPESITEQAELAPMHEYAQSKYTMEAALEQAFAQDTIKYYILRLSSPIPTDIKVLPNTILRKWLEDASAGKNLTLTGEGLRYQNFISTSDFAKLCRMAIVSNAPSGIYNAGSAAGIFFYEVAEAIAKTWGVSVEKAGDEIPEQWRINMDKTERSFGFVAAMNSTMVIHNLIKIWRNAHSNIE